MVAGSDLGPLVYDCFTCELDALKPGNVGRHGDGHGMTRADFIKSAKAVTPILCNHHFSLGKRILLGVEATLAAVHCNTNLGMLLLMTPVIRVFEQLASPANFQDSIKSLLKSLEREESRDIFAAISLANPGGLGKVDKYDVNSPGDIDIFAAMDAAKEWDLIALQYANGYREVINMGVKCLQTYHNRWNSVEWSVVACYLMYMASFPDSHIRRKHGSGVAELVQRKTVTVLDQFGKNENPDDAKDVLMAFDKELKDSGINPGTCADLTVASLLLYRLGVC